MILHVICIGSKSLHCQRQNAAPSASAQTAAAQAFLASRPSSANLSASAAAAALRTMSPAPTPVSGVQTKRMLQRQASTSSRGGERGELQRNNSSGSMTERTFRTPSPNRPGQTGGSETAPPVPPMPKTYNNGSSHRRAASMEPSMRVVSPLPNSKGGRVASLDRGPASTQKKPQTQRQARLTDVNELERTDSRGSVNFSYPTGARPNSPPALRPTSQSQHPITNGISQQSPHEIVHALTETAEQPVRKKKKKVTSGSAGGCHLASGEMGGMPLGTAVASSSADTTESTQTPTQPTKKKKKKKRISTDTGQQSDYQRDLSAYGSDSDSTSEISTAKRSQRASGVLNKQPSVVREDWDGEQEDSPQSKSKAEERAGDGISPVSSRPNVQSRKETAIPNTSKKITDSSDHVVQAARPTPHLITTLPPSTIGSRSEAPQHDHLDVSKDSARTARQTSISPSRSTRFSTHLASEFSGRPHEPPPRSVSPAKSALKHHSPSPQSYSPIDGATIGGWKRASQASSETSDTASMASADGFGSRPQRKKSARVSFEADPEVVGTAADVTPSDTPIFASPQHKDAMKKGWLGRSKVGHLDSIPAEDDMEEVMKPRPVLPSFGSVRGRRDESTERATPVTEITSLSSSETSSTSNLATLDTSISSDHAIGAILARESSKSQSAPKATVPKTTHTATTVMVAADRDEDSREGSNGRPQASLEQHRGPSMAPMIPSIAIQPATPGIAETQFQDEWLVEVPGGFPEPSEQVGTSTTDRPVSPENREVSTSSPADLGISEPKPSEVVAAEDPSVPRVGSFSQALRQQTEQGSDSESGGSSIYSDAAEDLSDLEGDGFGSINAIMESPAIGAPANSIITPPDSPLVGKSYNDRIGGFTRHDSWDKTEAHWKNVADRQRSVDQDQQKGQDTLREKPRKKKTKRVTEGIGSANRSKAGNLVPDSPQRTLPQPSSYPQINKDQASSSGQGPMRRSMRDQLEETTTASAPAFRSSLRTQNSSEPQVRTGPPASSPKGALQKKKKIPFAPSAPSPAARTDAKANPALSPNLVKPRNRRLSNDSDSSSSFKRSKRPVSSSGRFTMRTSMRGGDDRPTSPPAAAGRGVRSLSPQNRRPVSPMGQGTMRTTMRGSGDAGVASLRKQDQSKRDSVTPGFGKSRKSKATSSKPVSSKLKSRFADSDDESETRTFRSRFEDSSDEEGGMIKYRPVRGIPGKPVEGDSTDLEDSSDDGGKGTSKAKSRGLQSPKAINGVSKNADKEPEIVSPLASPASPVDGAKKKGLFGRFRSRKAKDSPKAIPPIEAEGEARQDQAQARASLQGARSPELPASPDFKGKLQRRHIPARMTSDSWPLRSTPPSDDAAHRPQTSDGTGAGTGAIDGANGHRPGLGDRQDTSGTVRTIGGTPVLGRMGKKKRFPMLRKAFGLHD
jgi:serine/arginine repetitive matrix protein 2